MSKYAPAVRDRLRSGVTWGLRALALAVLASTSVAAVHDVSQAWDVWYYHLPFAARIWGIVPREAFVMHAANEARFTGFPLLGEALQGLAWRAAGTPAAANLIAFAAVPGLALHLRARHGVPLHLTVLALLAVPLVMTHASTCYVDLPANACAAALVLVTWRAWSRGGPTTTRDVLVGGLCGAVATGMRFQLAPLVAVSLALLGVRARRSGGRALAALALTGALAFTFPIKNIIVHGNPVYPVRVVVAGRVLPGTEDPYAASPPSLERASRPRRWLWSVLEIGARPLASGGRWSVDQWTPPSEDAYRMGGFFGAYVVALLALFAWNARRTWRSRPTRAAVAALAMVTGVVCVAPQSHELRYTMAWMLVLAALTLATAGRRHPIGVGLVCASALAVVVWATGAAYVLPSGRGFGSLVRARTDPAVLDAIADGERVCLARDRWTFLYAAPFHPGRRYVVREVEDKGACGDARWIE
jgi:hypothetical protein